MRVSDELVERLGYALDACEFTTPYADVPSMLRRILEDVLLHVPEPEPGPHTRTLNAMAEMIADREVRIAELEAQIASVRPVDAVEGIMRSHDVVEIHFWQEGTSFDAITGEDFDVTITLRNARGVFNGATLATALARIPSRSTIGSKETP